jgi:hypothetical protein
MAISQRSNGNLVVTVRLTLRPGRDDDLILLIQNAPHGALAGLVRESMRSGVASRTCAFEDTPDTQPLDMSELGLDA